MTPFLLSIVQHFRATFYCQKAVVATLRLSRTHSKVYLNYAEAQQGKASKGGLTLGEIEHDGLY